jgi:hypothetical protein
MCIISISSPTFNQYQFWHKLMPGIGAGFKPMQVSVTGCDGYGYGLGNSYSQKTCTHNADKGFLAGKLAGK